MTFNNLNILLLILFVSIVSTPAICQEHLKSISIDLKTGNGSEVTSITDNDENIHYFFLDNLSLKHLIFNSVFDSIHKKDYPKPDRPYSHLQGYSVSEDNVVSLYFTNAAKNKFCAFSLDKEQQLQIEKFELPMKKEKIFALLNHDKKLNIFSFKKNTSIIKRYTFNKNEVTTSTYDFSGERFFNFEDQPVVLGSILNVHGNAIIDTDLPSSIDQASKLIKLYPSGNKLTISLNHRKSATRLLNLNLDNESSSLDYFPIPSFAFGNMEYVKSNSFINNGKLLQVISSTRMLDFYIYDMSTRAELKKYSITSDKEIPFKNSPIYQEGSAYSSNTRELEKTKQYLRKVTNSQRVGIAANEKDGKLNIKMGGVTTIAAGGMMMPMAGIPVGSFGAMTFSVSPTFFAYNAYASTRATYIKSVFDASTLNHVETGPFVNLFDKIEEYEEGLSNIRLVTLFKFKDYYVHSNYSKDDKRYTLSKFEN
ncbi:hypothetical protein [Flagellimonas flava]|uniref:hypothetical protein n=1 Tax=Flagellimonas flava TaxID=570519 RepID=UPI003D657D2A